jgi:pimeloyl-ACP methyl ester carboxylesterase
MTHYIHRMRDGRGIGVTGLGDPDATRLVLFCHPAPGVSGFDPDPTVTSTIGVRVVGLDRPGYGASDPLPDASRPMERWIDDVDEYLRTIESNARTVSTIDFGSIGVVGWGAGALYACALAGRYPQLVEGLVLVEPTAPTHERLSESLAPLDARLEKVTSLDRLDGHPGATDRMGFMLDELAQGDEAGVAFDRLVLGDASWYPLLGHVEARTLIVSAGRNPDSRWYGRRISHTRTSFDWPDPATTIVEAWPLVLGFLGPRESEAAEVFSGRRASSPRPQVQQRPR